MRKHQQARLLASLLLWVIFHPVTLAQTAPIDITVDPILPPVQVIESIQDQITSVNQLADVQPTDWAFQALQFLVERYSCISGYPNRVFRGNQAMNRYEFATGLSTCLDHINALLAATSNNLMRQEDLKTLRRLQAEFTTELATLRSRVDSLEVRTATLESQHFSTTTKLRGFVIMATNAGGFGGDRIIDISGSEITRFQPSATVLYRASLFLDTSFNGTDLLRILIEAGSDGIEDNTGGFLEPVLGSVLDYSAKPPASNDRFGLSRVFYTFKPAQDLEISIGPDVRITDYVDRNSYANVSARDFNTLAFVNNYILLPVSGPSAGAAIHWKPRNETFRVNATYVAAEAANPGNQGSVRAVSAISRILYPNSRGESGLFGDTYQGVVELEYAPSTNFALRLQYAGGQVLDNHFAAIGANLEWTLSPQFGIFGRYGYSWYNNTAFGDLNPQYWMAGITVRDLFKPGALAGLAAGQPFVEGNVGTGTQTNFEAFYRFPINDNIHISPVVQVITQPGNQATNGTVFSGTLRTVFSF
ncbi:MAG: iron uptake porin [Lyngbya sp. HA4199-MV5]|jgi:porin|nr:iron uptake porin [Lyngbya sp. HA4199-MV5]